MRVHRERSGARYKSDARRNGIADESILWSTGATQKQMDSDSERVRSELYDPAGEA